METDKVRVEAETAATIIMLAVFTKVIAMSLQTTYFYYAMFYVCELGSVSFKTLDLSGLTDFVRYTEAIPAHPIWSLRLRQPQGLRVEHPVRWLHLLEHHSVCFG